jgi:transposase InsO family protein
MGIRAPDSVPEPQSQGGSAGRLLEIQSAVFEYIEAFYNRQRRHSTLNMLSPIDYEQLRLSPLGG